MTMHYGDKVTADQIIKGWVYHGHQMPMCFATITFGDNVAYNCWIYLSALKAGQEDIPTIEEYCKDVPEDKKDEVIQILTETVEKFKRLEPSDQNGLPWPFNQVIMR